MSTRRTPTEMAQAALDTAQRKVERAQERVIKLPEFPRSPSIFFADEGHRLSRNDPNQPSLEGLRFPGRVNQATGEVTD